jgi:hypothetical protein
MIKFKFQYRFKHLEEKFNPSSDLGYYGVYEPKNIFFYN